MLLLLKSLSQLIYPPYCLLCKKPNQTLCPICLLQWQQPSYKKQIAALPLYFSNYYDDKSALLILAAKESGNLVARDLLAQAMNKGVQRFVSDFQVQGEIGLIGIPSRSSINRARGGAHIDNLIDAVINQHESNNSAISLQRVNILQIVKRIKDQSGLDKERRGTNMSGAYLAIHPESSIKNLIIVDDLITTGASIRAAITALSIVNLAPVAVITACAVSAHL